MLATVLCLLALCMALPAHSQRKNTRVEDERIYLDHADSLYYDKFRLGDKQIVRGNVKFRHKGSTLLCDSAYFKQMENKFEAYGHVRMYQGDTLEIRCDTALYDGNAEMVHAQHNVVVIHRKTSQLHTDNLVFDQKFDIVYYDQGGNYVDKVKGMTLSSDWGKYNLDTKEAEFFYDVTLKTKTHVVHTDTLLYDSQQEKAHVKGGITKTSPDGGRTSWKKSVVHSIKDGYDVETTNCFFYMKNDKVELFDKSSIVTDTRSISGDSLFYDSGKKISRGFGKVDYVDHKNKNQLVADAVDYNEATGTGLASRNPVFIDFSQKDTLYMHADTIRLETFYINTDSVYRKVHCYKKVRMYRNDVQAVCDSLVLCTRDSTLTMYFDPIVWNTTRQLMGDSIKVFMADSTVREANIMSKALSIEMMNDHEHPGKVYYNQVASQRMNAYFDQGKLRMSEAVGNVQTVYYPVEERDTSLIGMVYLETDTMRMYLSPERKLDKIWASKSEGVLYPMTQIPPLKDRLPNFGWYDYIRPANKDDIYYIEGRHDKRYGGGGDSTTPKALSKRMRQVPLRR
jgi:lipopolysaccharide export system protein LptA